ncbi:MAG TPA: cyclic nucleotide-binding domain-containing protein [Myxococcales bacterium]|jgi:CRP-like cAMP-binding protein|nr:cyclic nucleotide-binding domain-containing protein [Myxococcales bacterium]
MADSAALEELVRSVPLFQLVGAPQMPEILRLLHPEKLVPGQVLFREGQPGAAMWVLGQGTEVSLSARSEAVGRPVVVAHLKAGETIGDMALVDEGPRSATATVLKGGEAHRIDAADFRELREAHHPAAFRVLRKMCIDLCSRLRATSDRIAPQGEQLLASTVLRAVPLPTPDLLDAYGPFRGLPQVVKLALAQKLSLVQTTGPEVVFSEGDRGDAAYFVIDGQVDVIRGGKTLATMGPGAMFGMVALIDSGGRAATCSTQGKARLLRLGAAEFEALFAAGHRFSHDIVNLVARQLVQHLRVANRLLPTSGQEEAELPPPEQAEAEEEESEEVVDQLPLDQELEMILLSQDS